MNDIFSVKRFWKYFIFDLNNAKNKFGLSLLITGLCAIIIYVISTLFSLLNGTAPASAGWINITSSVLAIFITTIMFPVKVYGDLTERKAGSSWLMIPASSLEKFLSMSVIVCVILPACLFFLLTSGNLVVSLFASDYEILPQITTVFGENNEIFENLGLMAWLMWAENILAFTLGAICFKTGKTGKTILCYFAFGVLMTFIMLFAFGQMGFDENLIEQWMENMTAEKVQLLFNVILNVVNTLMMGGLLAGIYCRIKTLKH